MAVDIVFIIDKSLSMDNYINNVKNKVSSLADTLASSGVDYRLGLVVYADGRGTIQKYDFTSDVNIFKNNVNSIYVDGGGENGLTAIADGALTMDFRQGASKRFIAVTDEGYEENDRSSKFSGAFSEAEVIALLKNNNVQLDVFGMMKEMSEETKSTGDYMNYYYYGEGYCQDEWEPIANSTGGKFYDITGDYNLYFGDIANEIKGQDGGSGNRHVSFAHWSYSYNRESDTASVMSNVAATNAVVASTTLTINDSNNHEIWLDGSRGVNYGTISTVDASASSGTLVIAGDSASQSIVAGSGNASLWGGIGNVSDTLSGSVAGTTMFFFGKENGQDMVTSHQASDIVNLYDVTLADVSMAQFTGSGVDVALTDGSSLSVTAASDITFRLTDGQKWKAEVQADGSRQWKSVS